MATSERAAWPQQSLSLQELRLRAEHARRCRALPPLAPGETERLVAAYVAERGGVTRCAPAYLVPMQQ